MLLQVLLLLAQTNFGAGSDQTLATLGLSHADHATVAINAYGDIVIANHADSSSGRSLVEVTVIPSVGARLWRAQAPILLGSATAGIFGDDTCHKPDVAALGDDSFVVVWPRFSRSNPALARLEAARIITRDGTGQLLAQTQVSEEAPGVGFVVDGALDAGEAGVMPDVSPVDGTAADCLVLYAHESAVQDGMRGTLRDYELRLVRLDMSRNPNSPRWQVGSWVAASGLAIDTLDGGVVAGGYVLPDLVVDDFDCVVLAWEESVLAERPDSGGSDHWKIRVRRLQPLIEGQAVQVLEDLTRVGVSALNPQRRPMMSTSRLDAENSILLTWNEDLPGTDADQIRTEKWAFAVGGQPGAQGPLAFYWSADPTRREALPRPLKTSRSELCFAARDLGASRPILCGVGILPGGVHRMLTAPFSAAFTARPALALIELPRPGGGPLEQTIVVTYEGGSTRNPDTFRIHVWITVQ